MVVGVGREVECAGECCTELGVGRGRCRGRECAVSKAGLTFRPSCADWCAPVVAEWCLCEVGVVGEGERRDVGCGDERLLWTVGVVWWGDVLGV